jgi:hypothetical protein
MTKAKARKCQKMALGSPYKILYNDQATISLGNRWAYAILNFRRLHHVYYAY